VHGTVEEPFGGGAFVTAAIHNKRYYGLLVDEVTETVILNAEPMIQAGSIDYLQCYEIAPHHARF
jgi:hypothetical protein